MQTFMPSVELGLNQVQVIVRGMYVVAQCDGVHATELVLLREFYESCRADARGLASFDELMRAEFDAEEAKDILNTPALRETFLRSCLFLAFADGEFSASERACIDSFSSALGASGERLAELTDEVRGHLIRQIATIQNVDALAQVAKNLG